MLLQTNIPETTLSLVSAGVVFGDKLSDCSILNDRTNIIQAIVSGNRCGHAPNAPRFFNQPDNHKRRPSVLANAIDQLKNVYRRPKKFFRKLATFHPHDRQKRSERREAIASVSQVLLHYLELSTLRVGFFADPSKFIPLDLKYIAKQAGISISRAKRAIADLAKAGYLKLTRQFTKKDDGTFKGTPSIREIAVQFFIDLGIDIQKLFFSREWKRKKDEKSLSKQARQKFRGLVQAVTAFSGRVTSSVVKRHGKSSATDQTLISRALELHRANPERSPSDYLGELQRLIE
jgi:hypothetical protein